MSYFIRVCSIKDLEVTKTAPVRMRAGATELLLNSHTTVGNTVRADEAQGVYAETASPAELSDNTGKGADFRFEITAISSEPPQFAFSTHADGEVRWLSFEPSAPTVSFAKEVGINETFAVEALGAASGYFAIASVPHKMYLTMREVDGLVCLQGTDNKEERAAFFFDAKLGTGPLMPGRKYFLKTILGTVVGAASGAVVQTYAHGKEEEFLVEACKGGKRSSAGVQCYTFRTYDGRYLSVKATEAAPFGELRYVDHKLASECAFFLTSDFVVHGTFRVYHADTLLLISADAATDAMTMTSPVARYICDLIAFQTVETGRTGLRGAKRVAPIVKCPIARTHRALKHNKEAAMKAAGHVQQNKRMTANKHISGRHPMSVGRPEPRDLSPARGSILPAVRQLAQRAFPAAYHPLPAVEVEEEFELVAKDVAEDEQRVAVVTRSWAAKKWVVLALAAGFIVALLFVAQLIVSRNGGHFPLP